MATSLDQLRNEVKAAWVQACEVDGISPDSKFVVFSNTVEAAAYNELAGILLLSLRTQRLTVR